MSGRQRRAPNCLISRTNCWDVDPFCTTIPAIDRTGCSPERPRCISTERVLATFWFRLCQAARINQNDRPVGSKYEHEREKHHEDFTSRICNGGCGNRPLQCRCCSSYASG